MTIIDWFAMSAWVALVVIFAIEIKVLLRNDE